MMGLWVLVLISKLTLMLQVVMQGNVNGLKPIVNLLALSICKKTFLFLFKLRKDLVLLCHFHKTSFKCTLLSHHKRDFQTFYHLVGTLMKPTGQLKTLPLPIELMMIGRQLVSTEESIKYLRFKIIYNLTKIEILSVR